MSGLRLWPACFLLTICVAATESFKVPSGLALMDEGRWLLVSLERSGEVAMVRLADGVVTLDEVGERSGDILAIGGGQVLVSDPSAGQVRRFRFDPAGPSLEALSPLTDVGTRPYYLQLEGDQFGVSDRDFRQPLLKTIVLPDSSKASPLPVVRSSPLFISESVLFTPSPDRTHLRRYIRGKPTRLLKIRGSNIHSLVHFIEDEALLYTGARLSPVARTTVGDIHWGGLVEPQWVRAQMLRGEPHHQFVQRKRLGEIGHPGADPAGIVVDADGRIMVALAGSNEVYIEETFRTNAPVRLATGARPQQLLFDEARERLFVANTLGDSVTVVGLASNTTSEILLNPGLELRPRDHGERLFFDARLSFEGWMSCHTCHAEGGSNGELVDTLTDGGFGSPKQIPALHGVGDSAPYGWTGSKTNLETQVRDTLLHTMHHPGALREADITNLVAYLRSLPPPAPVAARFPEQIKQGREIFLTRKCDKCHAPPTYTTPKTYDVGLRDKAGNARFNPPSLRGLSQRHGLLHDGRGGSLRQLLGEAGHPADDEAAPYADGELEALMAFLYSL